MSQEDGGSEPKGTHVWGSFLSLATTHFAIYYNLYPDSGG